MRKPLTLVMMVRLSTVAFLFITTMTMVIISALAYVMVLFKIAEYPY